MLLLLLSALLGNALDYRPHQPIDSCILFKDRSELLDYSHSALIKFEGNEARIANLQNGQPMVHIGSGPRVTKSNPYNIKVISSKPGSVDDEYESNTAQATCFSECTLLPKTQCSGSLGQYACTKLDCIEKATDNPISCE